MRLQQIKGSPVDPKGDILTYSSFPFLSKAVLYCLPKKCVPCISVLSTNGYRAGQDEPVQVGRGLRHVLSTRRKWTFWRFFYKQAATFILYFPRF